MDHINRLAEKRLKHLDDRFWRVKEECESFRKGLVDTRKLIRKK
ncbi:hypothetical protein VBD025_00850 [Virgibacillus flavescens]